MTTEAETTLTVIASGTPTGDQFIWNSDDQITVGTAPAVGQTLKIQRDTPEDAQIVDWQDGSYIIAEDLNTSDKQWLYNLQELTDLATNLDGTVSGEAIKSISGTAPVEIDNTNDQTPVISVDETVSTDNPNSLTSDSTLMSEKAIDDHFKQHVGTAPATGTKVGQIRIDNTASPQQTFWWDGSAWVAMVTEGQKGDKGDTGPAPGLQDPAATVTNIPLKEDGEPGDATAVVSQDAESDLQFQFGIPVGKTGAKGDKGDKGDPGDGVTYKGPIDATTEPEPTDPLNGDFYVNTADGSSSWTGLGELTDGDRLVWNEEEGQWDRYTPSSATDLGYTKADDKGTITNTNGTDAEIPVVSNTDGDTNAGLMTPAMLTNLNTDPSLNDVLQVGNTSATNIVIGADGNNSTIGQGEITSTGSITASEDGTTGVFLDGDDETPFIAMHGDNAFINITNGDQSQPKFSVNAAGNGAFAGKVTSAATEDGDADATLATKGYVDGRPAGGVTQIIAGSNVSISPTGGTGAVTINATGGGGGGDGGDTIINYNGAAAWGEVNSDGTKAGTGLNFTCTLRDGETGIYDIVFDNPMPSTDYSLQVTALATTDVTAVAGGKLATGFIVRTWREGVGLTNMGFTFAVHANNAQPPRGGTGSDGWAITQADGTLDAGFNFVDANVTRVAAGTYDYTFTTPMPSANYAVVGMAFGSQVIDCRISSKTTTGFRFKTQQGGSTTPDTDVAHSVVVHATNAQLPDTVTQEQIDWAVNSSVSAWGNVTSAGVKSSGLNFTSTRTAAGTYTITFDTDMPNAGYSVQVVASGRTSLEARVRNKTAGSFEVVTFNDGDAANTDVGFQFTVHASNSVPPKGTTGADAFAYTGSGAVLQSSYNIASVTRTEEGTYSYTFSSPMPTNDYCIVPGIQSASNRSAFVIDPKTTAGFTIQTRNADNNTPIDSVHHVVVHASNAQLPQTVTQDEIDWAVKSSVSAWGRVNEDGNKPNTPSLNFASSTRTTDPGVYEVTFSTPMPNTGYSVVATPARMDDGSRYCTVGNHTTTGFTVRTFRDLAATNSGFNFTVHASNSVPPKGTTGADAFASTATDASLLSSYNIASCARPSNGRYDYVFGTAMPTANYAVTATSDNPDAGRFCVVRNKTTTGFSVFVYSNDSSTVNALNGMHSVAVFATNAQLPNTVTQDQIDRAVSGSVGAWGFHAGDASLGPSNLNVSGVVRNSEGNYTVTFANPMPNATYSVQLTPQSVTGNVTVQVIARTPTTINYVARIASTNAVVDAAVFFAVFATNAPAPKGGTGADAWARTGTDGTLSSSYNFASATRASDGRYDYVFTTPMPTAQYAVSGGIRASNSRTIRFANVTINGFTAITEGGNGTAIDCAHSVIVHATNATLPHH